MAHWVESVPYEVKGLSPQALAPVRFDKDPVFQGPLKAEQKVSTLSKEPFVAAENAIKAEHFLAIKNPLTGTAGISISFERGKFEGVNQANLRTRNFKPPIPNLQGEATAFLGKTNIPSQRIAA